jgi:hypothetical protein
MAHKKPFDPFLNVFLALFPLGWSMFGLPNSIYIGFLCWGAIVLKGLRHFFSNSVILPAIEIMLVLLGMAIVARAKFSPLKSDLVLDPNRANLGLVSPIYLKFNCFTREGWKTAGPEDALVVDQDTYRCSLEAKIGVTNYGPATIPQGYFTSVNILLEDHILDKGEEDSTVRAHGPSYGRFEMNNPLYGNKRTIFPFGAYSYSYSATELRRWRESSGAVLVLARSAYSDNVGPLYSEECFYLVPPDFVTEEECIDHSGTHSGRNELRFW